MLEWKAEHDGAASPITVTKWIPRGKEDSDLSSSTAELGFGISPLFGNGLRVQDQLIELGTLEGLQKLHAATIRTTTFLGGERQQRP